MRSILGSFISIISGRLGGNKGVRLMKFNAFRMDRETTHRKEGPRANRAVGVRTSGSPGFGTKGTLGSVIGNGWWEQWPKRQGFPFFSALTRWFIDVRLRR